MIKELFKYYPQIKIICGSVEIAKSFILNIHNFVMSVSSFVMDLIGFNNNLLKLFI